MSVAGARSKRTLLLHSHSGQPLRVRASWTRSRDGEARAIVIQRQLRPVYTWAVYAAASDPRLARAVGRTRLPTAYVSRAWCQCATNGNPAVRVMLCSVIQGPEGMTRLRTTSAVGLSVPTSQIVPCRVRRNRGHTSGFDCICNGRLRMRCLRMGN